MAEMVDGRGRIRSFYSDRAWIEGDAVSQVAAVAALPGMVTVSSFPDLHPGKNGPVGIAATSELIYPHLVGNDIGCGFAFFDLGIAARKLRADKAEERLRTIDFGPDPMAAARLEELGLSPDLFAHALGSLGGGNHFAELQVVSETLADETPLETGSVHLLVHTGSRSYGTALWDEFHERSGGIHAGFDPVSEIGSDWIMKQDACVRYAALNRVMVAERIAAVLRADLTAICNVPHNLVLAKGGLNLHFKGASCVMPGDIVPIAGSRDSLSHMVKATDGVMDSDFGISHGSGRKRDRSSMHFREGTTKSEREALKRNQWGGRVICDDNGLLSEEAASAYKNPKQIIEDLADAGLVTPICSMRPLVTYKKAAETDPSLARRKADRDKGRNRR